MENSLPGWGHSELSGLIRTCRRITSIEITFSEEPEIAGPFVVLQSHIDKFRARLRDLGGTLQTERTRLYVGLQAFQDTIASCDAFIGEVPWLREFILNDDDQAWERIKARHSQAHTLSKQVQTHTDLVKTYTKILERSVLMQCFLASRANRS
jgi:hypothetical protein